MSDVGLHLVFIVRELLFGERPDSEVNPHRLLLLSSSWCLSLETQETKIRLGTQLSAQQASVMMETQHLPAQVMEEQDRSAPCPQAAGRLPQHTDQSLNSSWIKPAPHVCILNKVQHPEKISRGILLQVQSPYALPLKVRVRLVISFNWRQVRGPVGHVTSQVTALKHITAWVFSVADYIHIKRKCFYRLNETSLICKNKTPSWFIL